MLSATLRLACLLLGVVGCGLGTQAHASQECPWPAVGTVVADAPELRSRDGVLRAELELHNEAQADGQVRYCYRTSDGLLAPTLRVQPGDRVILKLLNRLRPLEPTTVTGMSRVAHDHAAPAASHNERTADPCVSGVMAATSTNLHFHGLSIPAVCHQDEVLMTSVQPDEAPFEYRFQVARDTPPGLYWYHPHVHGFSARQVSGGASGAMIVEGLERAIPEVAQLPERVLVVRDLDLLHPDAPPSDTEPVVPRPLLDADGDAANNNTGYGTPARDLSVNFIPVPYPQYPPARILVRPNERQLWRVLNASAITYIHLAVLYDKVPQSLGVVALDGVPVNYGDRAAPRIRAVDHVLISPGSRAEFIVTAPPAGVRALLISRSVNTGQDGENVPNRTLATIEAAQSAPPTATQMPRLSEPWAAPSRPWVGTLRPVRTRKLYFSERRADPNDPSSATLFFLTVDGQQPKTFDPHDLAPDIVVHQGDVEDWIIENRSLELHTFHIHQLHFQLRDWYGFEVDEPFLRDTVSVPFFENHMTAYPSVTVRMDFRDPSSVGTFPYHCHILEHEDGGMMGILRVLPSDAQGP
jgi:FtsP/CotA-like multicopper oxidase with cupredoxin domain